MNIDELTIGQAKELAEMFSINIRVVDERAPTHALLPVLVCTAKRGVVFGYTESQGARPIKLTNARMCLYWSADVGGVFGLADIGPTKDCKISATVPSIILEEVTAVFEVQENAIKAWTKAPVQGR